MNPDCGCLAQVGQLGGSVDGVLMPRVRRGFWMPDSDRGRGRGERLRVALLDLFPSENPGSLACTAGTRKDGVLPPDTDVDWGRFPVVDVAVTGDEVTVHWDPSIGTAWDFTTKCFFEEVTLTSTIEDNGDQLTDASGSFTRIGSTCRNPDTPVPLVLGGLRRE